MTVKWDHHPSSDRSHFEWSAWGVSKDGNRPVLSLARKGKKKWLGEYWTLNSRATTYSSVGERFSFEANNLKEAKTVVEVYAALKGGG